MIRVQSQTFTLHTLCLRPSSLTGTPETSGLGAGDSRREASAGVPRSRSSPGHKITDCSDEGDVYPHLHRKERNPLFPQLFEKEAHPPESLLTPYWLTSVTCARLSQVVANGWAYPRSRTRPPGSAVLSPRPTGLGMTDHFLADCILATSLSG